jgi:hypothetical protein
MFCYSHEGIRSQEVGVKNAKRFVCIKVRLRFISNVTHQTTKNVRRFSDSDQQRNKKSGGQRYTVVPRRVARPESGDYGEYAFVPRSLFSQSYDCGSDFLPYPTQTNS